MGIGLSMGRSESFGIVLRPFANNPQLTRKFPTWQVMLQNRKSKELTVNLSSCGSYDSIRYNALHLTSNSRLHLHEVLTPHGGS